jgi:DNA helicase-2/ATP-dependent DNA helicase PcrA
MSPVAPSTTSRTPPPFDPLAVLNHEQRAAATFDAGVRGTRPLLVIAGAGTGKTTTLAHRVAQLILAGADPGRILLLTFTRRAAAEMTRRAEGLVAKVKDPARGTSGRLPWAGTFHAVANRLLRLHGAALGLDASFTVLDRGDAEDLLDLERTRLGLDKKAKRFPKKGTCLAIYSRRVNSGADLDVVLDRSFPWCASWEEELRTLFRGYVEAKQRQQVLDYDDLLLYWSLLVSEPACAREVAARFDHVLVDEYQDTNALQAEILLALRPDGAGLTVVGDDAQSIYGFRAADVRNITSFPDAFDQGAEVITLARNYRSSQPILDAANAVINESQGRFQKALVAARGEGPRPRILTVEDEARQAEVVAAMILERREEGLLLREQAVLVRAAHHSDALEVELARRDIPFVKFGGLKFLEAAHVKDVLAILRWAENPRDEVAAFRVLQLLRGVGPASARRAVETIAQAGLAAWQPPAEAAPEWEGLRATLDALRGTEIWAGQLHRVHAWYLPVLERLHENAPLRASDLEQLELVAASFPSRERFLAELALDPPATLGEEAGPPQLDEDWLTVSTIHSAKGQEWGAVFVLNVVDGCMPSDLAAGSREEIEEERRLLYVAMTRAKDHLTLVQPQRFFVRSQSRTGDRAIQAPNSRFLPPHVLAHFEREVRLLPRPDDGVGQGGPPRIDAAKKLRSMWD